MKSELIINVVGNRVVIDSGKAYSLRDVSVYLFTNKKILKILKKELIKEFGIKVKKNKKKLSHEVYFKNKVYNLESIVNEKNTKQLGSLYFLLQHRKKYDENEFMTKNFPIKSLENRIGRNYLIRYKDEVYRFEQIEKQGKELNLCDLYFVWQNYLESVMFSNCFDVFKESLKIKIVCKKERRSLFSILRKKAG